MTDITQVDLDDFIGFQRFAKELILSRAPGITRKDLFTQTFSYWFPRYRDISQMASFLSKLQVRKVHFPAAGKGFIPYLFVASGFLKKQSTVASDISPGKPKNHFIFADALPKLTFYPVSKKDFSEALNDVKKNDAVIITWPERDTNWLKMAANKEPKAIIAVVSEFTGDFKTEHLPGYSKALERTAYSPDNVFCPDYLNPETKMRVFVKSDALDKSCLNSFGSPAENKSYFWEAFLQN